MYALVTDNYTMLLFIMNLLKVRIFHVCLLIVMLVNISVRYHFSWALCLCVILVGHCASVLF